MLYPDTLRQMTEDYNLGYQQASPEEILKFTPQLLATYNSTAFGTKKSASEEEISKKEFFKVRFTEALDLVRGRKVFIRGGECYVPISDLQHLLVFKFKSLLTLNVANLAKILPNLDEDERLGKKHALKNTNSLLQICFWILIRFRDINLIVQFHEIFVSKR